MKMAERVYCLYRVSTTKQVDHDEKNQADIPMQRKACHEFADKMGWRIVGEEQETGVSGYKVSKERDFTNSNFDDIKRVYSVWICPKMDENSIEYIHLTREILLGRHQWEGNIDLLNIMMLGLSKEIPEHDEKYALHRLLGTLLSSKLRPEEKLEIMNKEYAIPMDQTIRKEVDNMYSLTQEIREQAASERESQIILNMYQNRFSLDQISISVGKTVDEIKAILTEKKSLLV